MKLSEIGQLLNVTDAFSGETDVAGIAQNADQVRPGFVFIALKGAAHNGADFIPQAEQNGCVAVVADQEVVASVPVIRVADARHALAILAAAFYPAENLKKVAVTGTNGKTSTVYLPPVWAPSVWIRHGGILNPAIQRRACWILTAPRMNWKQKAFACWQWKHPAMDWIKIGWMVFNLKRRLLQI